MLYLVYCGSYLKTIPNQQHVDPQNHTFDQQQNGMFHNTHNRSSTISFNINKSSEYIFKRANASSAMIQKQTKVS